ncbi:DUF4238 domain-containing protein [Vibrio cholerae]|uniref:DUF4238 domain-containing protein n=3 Tax=Vibrio cholerae TaxID=666 RepID=UPI00158148FA|nr:DUF4238 domain-containing protein [Vibrio cholerae]EGR1421448.1 DUF4238 domain-containing protein [Vibrio cholerae]EIY4767225.1 DUF4238 domain-containing protein [Vibrio cholerae]EJL6702699.1 DUF4238 domain-containing protein [Vibrio cholerae]ELE7142855.1 DUF4238 domain-containing protein [Vibrio cholerae]ELU8126827.1 DUF4238 domain-containing protein [Vibrio cholerae]
MGDITINQHYVPRFLLEGFRVNPVDEKLAKINVLMIRNSKLLRSQSVSEVFSQNYFYDKDNRIENFIECHIESPSSKLINQFRNGKFNSLNKDCQCLTKLLCCQLMRTQEALNESLRVSEERTYHIAEELLEQNEIAYEDDVRDLFHLDFQDRDAKRNVIAQLVLDSVLISKGMEDLRFHILVNKTSEDFIISDHPVIKYNWFYKDLNALGVAGLMNKGVQLFLPLSHRLYLCAYDSDVYKYGAKNSDISEVISLEDVRFLNTIQIRNSSDLVALGGAFNERELRQLVTKYHGQKLNVVDSVGLGLTDTSSKVEPTVLGTVYYIQRNLFNKPSFFKVLKKSKIYQDELTVRDPYLAHGVNMLFAYSAQQIHQKIEP